ncbi:hypothetical protein KY290_014364 [Solanum tuberosum]|uniref:Uncharacterized protein n=1 Tax=Solanum tuberosum TaxID=4113 RepID=A0ABQ7VR80_SOLTU|nr:hypothetical protein KY289_014425 [Solanum tuberosum]KAH0699553.1 hypothetical protein KY284_013768 [Solanum tuberosum]KAH0770383.1 hypothetical protein KY290_014364 [Solanum tuberosum]
MPDPTRGRLTRGCLTRKIPYSLRTPDPRKAPCVPRGSPPHPRMPDPRMLDPRNPLLLENA